MNQPTESQSVAKPKPRAYADFFNYFGKEKRLHSWFAEKRTKLLGFIFPSFVRLGLAPDTISYIGIALLTGVILYFLRNPKLAVLFLVGHLVCDGMDGAFARHAGKASQSGAFTDLVCDQLGMVVVSMMAIFHHMVSPVLGAVYITLYLIVVVFGVIINAMGLGTRVTITSKYILYSVYAIWAWWGINLFTWLMSFFSAIMAIEVLIGYFRLKRGIRRKFDSPLRFSAGDTYSGHLNYVLNVAVPLSVFLGILIWGNWIPISTMLDHPRVDVAWQTESLSIHLDEGEEIVGVAAHNNTLLVMVRRSDSMLEVRASADENGNPKKFLIPEYVNPAFSGLPVDGNVLLLIDNTTRLLMGIDMDASFRSGRAVLVITLPVQYLRITGLAVGMHNGKRVWLAANYLYTRKTYIIDPEKALRKGYLSGGVMAAYVNSGFPSGLVLIGENIVEYASSPMNRLMYVAPLTQMIGRKDILSASLFSIEPPTKEALGPVMLNETLVMMSPRGALFRLPIEKLRASRPLALDIKAEK